MSSTSNNNRKARKSYILITIFCLIFSFVYEIFSHQVYSPFMVGLFAIPLFLGLIPNLLIRNKPSWQPADHWPQTVQAFAIATLLAGSALQGILEIYGTTNLLTNYFFLSGLLLLGLSIVLYVRAHFKQI